MIPVEPHANAPQAAEAALLLGLLIGEGHFGGDGKQPHVVLRMHARHEPLFRWINVRWPLAKVYGPYHHGGRHYFQLMWRGNALRYGLMPWLESFPWVSIDAHSFGRYGAMKERYGLADVPAFARKNVDIAAPASPAEGPLCGDAVPAGEPLAGRHDFLEDDDP